MCYKSDLAGGGQVGLRRQHDTVYVRRPGTL